MGEQCFERQFFKRIVPELISQGCVLGGMPREKLGRWAAGGKEKRRSSDAHDAANRLPTLGTLLLRLVRNHLVLHREFLVGRVFEPLAKKRRLHDVFRAAPTTEPDVGQIGWAAEFPISA